MFDEEFTPDIQSSGEAIDYGWFYLGEFPNDLLYGVDEMFKNNKKTLENIICFYQDKSLDLSHE